MRTCPAWRSATAATPSVTPRDHGVTGAEIDAMLVADPARILSGATPSATAS